MAIRRWKALAAGLAAMALSVGQAPASAAPAWASEQFKVCIDGYDCNKLYIEVWIWWGNRTATVRVDHYNSVGWGDLTGHFDAFAGTTKVDSVVTRNDFEFNIGNPNLVGGINRIRTQACLTGSEGQFVCSDQNNQWRD